MSMTQFRLDVMDEWMVGWIIIIMIVVWGIFDVSYETDKKSTMCVGVFEGGRGYQLLS